MWNGQQVSVVLVTYAERDSIRAVIEGFLATGVVDEVVVVDNNAERGTADEVGRTRARLVAEPRQGYGHATRRGLEGGFGEVRELPSDIVNLDLAREITRGEPEQQPPVANPQSVVRRSAGLVGGDRGVAA